MLQLHAVFGEQSQCRSEYVACALTVADVALPTPDEVDTARAGLEAAMKVLWKLPWDNVRKETPSWVSRYKVPVVGHVRS